MPTCPKCNEKLEKIIYLRISLRYSTNKLEKDAEGYYISDADLPEPSDPELDWEDLMAFCPSCSAELDPMKFKRGELLEN